MADAVNTTNPSRRSILSALSSIPCVVASTAFVALDDKALIDLGRRLDEAWASQISIDAGGDSNAQDAAYEVASGIVRQIEKAPAAVTVRGLKVKAKAVSWCLDGEPVVAGEFAGEETADIRLLTAIARDLLSIGA